MGKEHWRIGRSVGRTVYIQAGDDASKSDKLIGVMDTPELAQRVVNAVNGTERIRAEERRRIAEHLDRLDHGSAADAVRVLE